LTFDLGELAVDGRKELRVEVVEEGGDV